MGCCGSSQNTPVTPWVNPTGASVAPSEVYVVRYPTGVEEEFAVESDAYHAIRLTGGSVSRKPIS